MKYLIAFIALHSVLAHAFSLHVALRIERSLHVAVARFAPVPVQTVETVHALVTLGSGYTRFALTHVFARHEVERAFARDRSHRVTITGLRAR